MSVFVLSNNRVNNLKQACSKEELVRRGVQDPVVITTSEIYIPYLKYNLGTLFAAEQLDSAVTTEVEFMSCPIVMRAGVNLTKFDNLQYERMQKITVTWFHKQNDYIRKLTARDMFTCISYTMDGCTMINGYLRKMGPASTLAKAVYFPDKFFPPFFQLADALGLSLSVGNVSDHYRDTVSRLDSVPEKVWEAALEAYA